MQSLFNAVLLVLISYISGGNFPLDALSFIPLVTRRRLFLLLPMVDLHRLERHHPAATDGINMAKIWKEVFAERLCEGLRWLTESHALQVTVTGNRCYFRVSTEEGVCIYDHIYATDIQRVLCAIPLPPDLAKGGVGLLKKIRCRICSQWNCKECQDHKFFYSSKYARLCAEGVTVTPNLETIVSLVTEIFPVQIDSTLVIGALGGLVTPPFNATQPEFHHLLCHFQTLQFTLCGFITWDQDVTHACKFLEALLYSLVSNPQSKLQNLHLCLCRTRYRNSKPELSYYKFIMDAISPFFTVSKSSNFTPFLHLKGLQIEVKATKQDVRKLVAIITSQVELEQLHILFICSSRKQRTPCCTFDALFKAVEGCFHKPTFRCLIVEDFRLTTATVLDILQEFLVSTACQDQQLTLKNLKIDSSNVRRSITYASESKVCRKSLSVERCSMTDEGIFSTADIASGILLHPGIKSVEMTRSLDHVDIYKLTAALERGTGTLKHLDLSGYNMSSIIVRAGPFFCALFHLPHLSELELVLNSCSLNVEDFDDLYRLWEKESSGKKRRRQSLRKLCVYGNVLPEDKSNLEMMARSLCC